MTENLEVHRRHCCKVCGCKYGYPDCPVVNNIVEPVYECWECKQTDYHGCGEYIMKIDKLENLIKDILKITL